MPIPARTLSVVLLSLIAATQAAELRSPAIAPEQLKDLLAGTDPPMVIDVRSPTEYSSAHLPGAVNVPAPTVTRQLSKIRQAPQVVLYCNDAQFTAIAEQLLLSSKVTGFSHLEGGLTAWQAQGLPVEISLPE
jgi:rhodanese-related sulfurtransferase